MPTFGLLDPLGIFHLDSEQFGHTSTSLFAFLYKMQSFGHVCIFSYCIPKAHNVFFASYIDVGIKFPFGSTSPQKLNGSLKLALLHPYFVLKLYNRTKIESLVNPLQPVYKGRLASSNKSTNFYGLHSNRSLAASIISTALISSLCGLLNSQSHWIVGAFTNWPQPAKQKEDDGGVPSPLRWPSLFFSVRIRVWSDSNLDSESRTFFWCDLLLFYGGRKEDPSFLESG